MGDDGGGGGGEGVGAGGEGSGGGSDGSEGDSDDDEPPAAAAARKAARGKQQQQRRASSAAVEVRCVLLGRVYILDVPRNHVLGYVPRRDILGYVPGIANTTWGGTSVFRSFYRTKHTLSCFSNFELVRSLLRLGELYSVRSVRWNKGRR